MRIQRLFFILLLLGTLLYGACLVWLYSKHLLFSRRNVLKVPVRFEKGFSLQKRFSVDAPGKYWLGLRYDDVFRSNPETPLPRDEFEAEFEIISRSKLISGGNIDKIPGWKGPWAVTHDEVTRYLDAFDAEPGRTYGLSLHIDGATPRLHSKRANAIIEIDWRLDEFYPLRNFLLLTVGLSLATLIVIYICGRRREG